MRAHVRQWQGVRVPSWAFEVWGESLDAPEWILDGSVMIYIVVEVLYYNANGRIGDQSPSTAMLYLNPSILRGHQ